ncbi:aldo/keto reductase [Arthrobacter burdickii]|uniref:Aldo/keto reductase n=1 Tax=Arthrobacter burdickii TaxID=3035920 RepID=A0ABT8K2Y5_9MICC|nr:aldo/keto reductase [Arthrobacter burdickii]MDN4611437.1 aldo/keto reductase [Arthrobacter burdickii]
MSFSVPRVALADGTPIDVVGYGVYKVPPADTAHLCSTALDAGYRLLDTAALYGNEAGVGEAARAYLETGDREDLFVTSKVWNDDHGHDATLRAFDASMDLLGLDRLDLYLIHWPCPSRDLYVETWRALGRLQAEGRVRSIGVSNFQRPHLERLLVETGVVPVLNQIELHPYLQQHDLRSFHERHGIATQAWSPLGRGNVLQDPVVGRIAAELGRTPAQVILRWHLQHGILTIPKASSRERISSNLDIFGFVLTDTHLAALDALDRDQRFGSHPDRVG